MFFSVVVIRVDERCVVSWWSGWNYTWELRILTLYNTFHVKTHVRQHLISVALQFCVFFCFFLIPRFSTLSRSVSIAVFLSLPIPFSVHIFFYDSLAFSSFPFSYRHIFLSPSRFTSFSAPPSMYIVHLSLSYPRRFHHSVSFSWLFPLFRIVAHLPLPLVLSRHPPPIRL